MVISITEGSIHKKERQLNNTEGHPTGVQACADPLGDSSQTWQSCLKYCGMVVGGGYDATDESEAQK